MKNYLFTSESVSEGHPDKMADQISDSILDAMLAQDPKSRVACETMISTGFVTIAGEVTTKAQVDVNDIIRNTVKNIGYDDSDMCGYAINENDVQMPLSISLSHDLVKNLATLRKQEAVNYLRPDSKSQVTIEYVDGKPKRVDAVVISTQHGPDVKQSDLTDFVREELIKKTIPANLIDNKTKFFINPTGQFIIGGPMGDCGLTGRKIIVDTYGGHGAHGGGAFSGKDSTKVDRSAAYACRHVAKNIVAAGLAEKCLVQASYAIGVSDPVSLMIEDYGTSKAGGEILTKAVREIWSLKPADIISQFKLTDPRFTKTAAYGHFGRTDSEFTWEATDKIDALKDVVKTLS